MQKSMPSRRFIPLFEDPIGIVVRNGMFTLDALLHSTACVIMYWLTIINVLPGQKVILN